MTTTGLVTDAVVSQALHHAAPLARSEPCAAAMGLLLAAQSALGGPRERSEWFLRRLTGTTSTAQHRAERERSARRVLAPMDTGRQRAIAFWHEGGSGSPVLLLSGWTASGLMWPSALVGPLEERFHVIRVDNRGSGYSRCAPTPASIATMADDAAAALRAANPEPAVVVGLSMGGMIAQELALRHPTLVRALVLVGTRPPAPAHLQVPGDVVARLLRRAAPRQPVAEFVAQLVAEVCGPGFAATHPDRLEELVGQILARPTPKILRFRQMIAIAAWHAPRRLAAIACPTTVVHGDVDPLMPVGNGMRLARLVPGARYVELAGVGHLPPVEAPEVLVDAIHYGRSG
jgi:pimeloyl-ACP methyl ester carboxylesterase